MVLKRKSIITIASLAVVGAVVGFGVSSAVATSALGGNPNEGRTQVNYAKNTRGETYGSAADSSHPGAEPDLIFAIGKDGKTHGYVRKADLESRAMPKSPEEVAARVAAGQTGRVGDKEVPLYAQDGVTVVGVFVVKGWGTDPGLASAPQK